MKLTKWYLFACVSLLMLALPVSGAPAGDGTTAGLNDQWYLGLGGGTAFLQPDPVDSSIDNDEDQGRYGGMTIGRDMGRLSSLQLQYHSLGSVALSNGEDADYEALDLALLYRFYDSRDRQLSPGNIAIALYGMAALGSVSRDIDSGLELEDRAEFYLGYGGGAELFLGNLFSVRLQASVIDQDAQYASLSLVARFGGGKPQPAAPGGQTTTSAVVDVNGEQASQLPQTPVEVAAPVSNDVPLPELPAPELPLREIPVPGLPVPDSGGQLPPDRIPPIAADADSDGDGVPDSVDECAGSAPGYPVRDSGCPLLNGVLSAVKFRTGSSVFQPESLAQLDALASLLKRYPDSRIQILVHTDTSVSERQQAILTRGRIRALGTYLLNSGIRANRLILRSMGGTVPVSDNSTAEGRALNNRIEILEYR